MPKHKCCYMPLHIGLQNSMHLLHVALRQYIVFSIFTMWLVMLCVELTIWLSSWELKSCEHVATIFHEAIYQPLGKGLLTRIPYAHQVCQKVNNKSIIKRESQQQKLAIYNGIWERTLMLFGDFRYKLQSTPKCCVGFRPICLS